MNILKRMNIVDTYLEFDDDDISTDDSLLLYVMNYNNRAIRKWFLRCLRHNNARSQCVYSLEQSSWAYLSVCVGILPWELTPCIFYTPQVLGLLDSWRNHLYTVFNVPICFYSNTNICLRKGRFIPRPILSERVFSHVIYKCHCQIEDVIYALEEAGMTHEEN